MNNKQPEPVFSKEFIEKVTAKPKWYIRFLLLFCKPIYGVDFDEWTTYVVAKKLFGKTYIQEVVEVK